jgi:pimeloyl-ACP methyl ester carboxylesterase
MMPGGTRWSKAHRFLRLPRAPSFVDMVSGQFRTARYTRAWLTGRHRCVEEEINLDRDGTAVPASLVHPDGKRRPFPAWVVLHGITRRGREHAQLARFTRAVVSTGAVAIVPEVPEWRTLSLAPRLAAPSIRAGIAGLRESGWARDAPVGVIGFSFGAPHAVSATAHPDLGEELAGAVSFGGYCDLARTVRFLMTGTHEWRDRVYRLIPDPYGRWIIAANYLTAIEAHRGAHDVTGALRALAQKAGDLGVPSLSPQLDPYKAELRAGIAEERVALFDLFAPGSAILPDLERGTLMAQALVEAAMRTEPEMDPRGALAGVRHPVHLLHGRRDHLIPFSESLRLRQALPEETPAQITITRLFGHSAQDSFPSFLKAAREVPVFLSALRKVLRLV